MCLWRRCVISGLAFPAILFKTPSPPHFPCPFPAPWPPRALRPCNMLSTWISLTLHIVCSPLWGEGGLCLLFAFLLGPCTQNVVSLKGVWTDEHLESPGHGVGSGGGGRADRAGDLYLRSGREAITEDSHCTQVTLG